MILAILFLIYGSDTRLDAYEVDAPEVQELIERSVILYQGSFDPRPLHQQHELCEEERFRDQPAVKACSGVLIDQQRVLTATHCVRDCQTLGIATGFVMRDEATHQSPEHYACAEVLQTNTDSTIILLDRPVPNLTEIVTATVSPGDPLLSVSHPLGLPAKLDLAGTVEAMLTSDSFYAAIDLYQGSSGSGVYTHEGKLAGIAIQGQSDFELDRDTFCLRSRLATVGRERIVSPDLDSEIEAPSGCTCSPLRGNIGWILACGAIALLRRRSPAVL